MLGIKRKHTSSSPKEISSFPKSQPKDKKKHNIFNLLKNREIHHSAPKIHNIVDTISFPFYKNKMTFYKLHNRKYIDDTKKEHIIESEYDIEDLLKNKNINYIYKLEIKKDNIVFDTIHNIKHMNYIYNGSNYEYSNELGGFVCVTFDIIGVEGLLNYLKGNKHSLIGNNIEIFQHFYCNKDITDLYYIKDEDDVLDKLNMLYSPKSLSFEIKEESPPNSGGGKSKKTKILYKKKIRTVYKNLNKLKYIKFNNKHILLTDIKGKYKYIK